MSERPKTDWKAVTAAALVLILCGSLGYLLLDRLDGMNQLNQQMEEHLVLLRDQVEDSRTRAREAGETSQAALARAGEAEENARQAALGRIQAEQARAEADQEAEEAGRKTQEARQAAELANEQARLAREETDQIRRRREAEIERLRMALGKIVDTERTAVGLVMTLSSDSIHFDFDKADLRAEDRELLSRIAGVLLTAYGFRLDVHGHTDAVGSGGYNQALSEQRAQSVRNYLVGAGIAADQITTKGFGKTSPRAPGATAEARAKNRRVEIAIIDSVIDYQGEVSQTTR